MPTTNAPGSDSSTRKPIRPLIMRLSRMLHQLLKTDTKLWLNQKTRETHKLETISPSSTVSSIWSKTISGCSRALRIHSKQKTSNICQFLISLPSCMHELSMSTMDSRRDWLKLITPLKETRTKQHRPLLKNKLRSKREEQRRVPKVRRARRRRLLNRSLLRKS